MTASRKERRADVYAKCGGRCGYCGHSITIEAMQIDHIHPKVDGGTDALENLLPSCRTCNNYKLFWSLEKFRAMVADQINLLRRNAMNFRMAERYGLAFEYPSSIVFYFERPQSDNSP
jgi:5-methylcytosine-specific restriction endonuclease McrA